MPANADLYIALVLPDGTLLVVQPQFAGFSAAIAPMQANTPVPNVAGPVFSYTFIGTEPIGTYTWDIGIANAGTMNFNTSIASVSFTFAP